MAKDFLSRKALLCIVCLILAGGGCDQLSPETKKTAHRERAQGYFAKGQYQEAVIEYRNVSQLDPKDVDAHYHQALAYMNLGGLNNLKAAFSEFQETVRLDESNADAQLKLAQLYALNNQPREAREHAEKALTLVPQNPEGLAIKGRSLLQEQRYEAGIESLEKALHLQPKNVGLYIDLAHAHALNKDQAAAESILKEGLDANPQSVELLVAMGDYRGHLRRFDEAESLYKQAVDLEPKNDSLYSKLADLYLATGQWDVAESVYQKLVSLKPEEERPHLFLGDFYRLSGQLDRALTSYEHAVKVAPSSRAARDKIIAHYLDAGKIVEAEGRVKAILEKDPRDLSGRYFTARLHLSRLEFDEAMTLLQGVIKEEPKFAEAHYYYGSALLQKQQVAQARGEIGEAVKLAPGFADAHVALAAIHLSEGFWDFAIEQAKTALRLNPRNVQSAIILGEALFRKGEKGRSRQVFEQLSKNTPTDGIGPFKLGVIARNEKNESQALAYFEEALKRQPGAIEPLAEIASILMSHGKGADARQRVIRQINAVSTNALMYNLLGELWLVSKEKGQAEEAFKKAIERDGGVLAAYINLGILYQETGRDDEAIKAYEAVVAKNPQYAQAYVSLGMIYESRRDHERAIAQFKEALKVNNKLAPAANGLAWILAEQGKDLDVALSYAQLARQQQPEDPGIADTLGWIYFKKKAYLMAIELLKEASEKQPQHPLTQFHYGMALYKNGDVTKAKKALEASLKLNPNYEGSDEARKALATL